ncbi:hypothetical protein COL26b_011243 [Colletotrichum chrysophilum]|uniref:uncharacterized protein n=1 Tax=Colletotrichum chrysophilum TaxID=1836956 RepID=UPI002301D919|nr:uncharacterized protein COL26b_011243 [Colletotrichum chrysophilum]KAJ0367403.1 hypothetical protein COL26b_011243 [Colletotrichum chrysophilum]
MSLPPEIIDQIVDQYVSVARVQTFHEVRDLDEWVNFTGGRDSTAVFYGGENEPYESTFFRLVDFAPRIPSVESLCQ